MKKDEKDDEPIDVTKYTLVDIVPKFLTVFPDLEFYPNGGVLLPPNKMTFLGLKILTLIPAGFFFLFSQALLRVK